MTAESHNTHGNVQVIPAIEEAMVGMKVGGVRRLIVPQELGYPGQPPDFTKQGPTPGNFSVSPDNLQYGCVPCSVEQFLLKSSC